MSDFPDLTDPNGNDTETVRGGLIIFVLLTILGFILVMGDCHCHSSPPQSFEEWERLGDTEDARGWK